MQLQDLIFDILTPRRQLTAAAGCHVQRRYDWFSTKATGHEHITRAQGDTTSQRTQGVPRFQEKKIKPKHSGSVYSQIESGAADHRILDSEATYPESYGNSQLP